MNTVADIANLLIAIVSYSILGKVIKFRRVIFKALRAMNEDLSKDFRGPNRVDLTETCSGL